MLKPEMETRTAVVVLEMEGYVRATAREGVIQSGDDARENILAAHAMCGSVRRPLLVDLRQAKFMEREAREQYAAAGNRYINALAVLVESDVSRMIASLLLRITEKEIPVQLFSSEGTAIEWVLGFVTGEAVGQISDKLPSSLR